jgi:hypothetical protein
MNAPMFDRLAKGFIVAVIAAAVPAVGLAAAGTAGMTSNDYSAAKKTAKDNYKAAKAKCDTMQGNAKDVCVAEAKAAEKKAIADAEAQYKNTDKARRDAKVAAAEADYDVAKAKCGVKTGNDKDVCVKEAKATETKAKADAKATEKVASVREDTRQDKMDADYKVALEKCDAMSGADKDRCKADAKVRFHR